MHRMHPPILACTWTQAGHICIVFSGCIVQRGFVDDDGYFGRVGGGILRSFHRGGSDFCTESGFFLVTLWSRSASSIWVIVAKKEESII